ncbi:MAG TPA: thioredoxin family protein [Terracidiphilus sp.]|nr:thioredoxin family protein [Terracidiphilus sp.]
MNLPRHFLVAASLLLAAGPVSSAGRVIYPDPSVAKVQLAAALKTATATHKRVLLDFGGNWCSDCVVLDIYMHNAENLPILQANYVLVHVNVGRYDANLDLAKRYRIPLKLGVPALAVLSSHGSLIYSQEHAQFEKMGRVEPGAVTEFLIRWKPIKPGCSAVMVSC